MMLRLSTLFVAFLALLGNPLQSQNCPPPQGLQLEIGLPDWATSPMQVQSRVCETSEPEGFLEVSGEEGTWFSPWVYAYVEADPQDPNQVALVQQIEASYPWLAKPAQWSFNNKTSIIPVEDLLLLSQLPLLVPDDDEVKRTYHPILDLDPLQSTETIQFNAASSNWSVWPLVPGNPPLTVGDYWATCLFDPENSDYGSRLYNFQSFLALGINQQGGAQADAFLNSALYSQAIGDGVFHITIQAISYKSVVPGHITTSDPVTTGGLTGYSQGTIPTIDVSNPVTVHLSPQLPVGGGPPGGGTGYHFRLNSWNLLRVRNAVLPVTISVTTPNGVTHSVTSPGGPGPHPQIPIRLGRIPGTIKFFLPDTAVPPTLQGQITVTTPYGSTADPSLPSSSVTSMQLTSLLPQLP